MTCDEIRDRLLDFVEGELPADSRDKIAAHLKRCSECESRARDMRMLVGDLSAARLIEQRAMRSQATLSTTVGLPRTMLPSFSTLGDFEIIDEIGRGGMGVVYRARQITLNRVVALKVLAVGGPDSDRAIERFVKEAQAAARLHHTNIVPIYGQGHERSCFFYAMELVDGAALDKLLHEQRELHSAASPGARSRSWVGSAIHSLRQMSRHGDARDFKRITRQIAEVAEALQHAHDQGIVHRDIKPQNLLIGRDDKLHITDFGLARILDEPGMTRSSEMVGTPAYMAPEQIHSGAKVDQRADIYSLGVTLYEMLTLQRPFQADSYERMIHQVLKREPTPPRRIDPNVPADLETICLRAMEKEPAARFASAGEFARELRRYADDYPIASRRVGPLGKLARWIRRNPARAAALSASLLVVMLAIAGWRMAHANANERISRAYRLLLDDYDDPSPALNVLGSAGGLLGDARRADMVRALAGIKQFTRSTITRLSEHVAAHPDDPEAWYLLAWAYARLADQGDNSLWPEAQRCLDVGDRFPEQSLLSGAAYFFKGQALAFIDPREAYDAFAEALKRDAGSQAALHQGRVANSVLLMFRDPRFSYEGQKRLESACLLRPNRAYPHYLLSISYRLWAVYNQETGRADEAEVAFSESLRIARLAQQVEPDDPRGYVAEAEYFEAREQWREALAARALIDSRASDAKKRNFGYLPERWAYPMRIHFWLDELADAEIARAKRYPPADKPRDAASETYDADEAFYRAVIQRSAGDERSAGETLAHAVRRAGPHAEERLRLAAAYVLCGITLPADVLAPAGGLDFETRRSARWTPRWIEALTQFVRDEITFEALRERIPAEFPQHEGDRRRAATGLEFFRGVKALRDGDRAAAVTAFESAHLQHDMENYCFRAKFVLFKMKRDEAWPQWLTERPISDR